MAIGIECGSDGSISASRRRFCRGVEKPFLPGGEKVESAQQLVEMIEAAQRV